MIGRKFTRKTLVTTLPKGLLCVRTWGGLTRDQLLRMRSRAIRQGVWFRVLSRAERVYMELAIKVVDRVRSHLVAKLLASIIGKLQDAMRGKVARVMKEIGYASAQKLSRIAQNWGNMSASRWVENRGFIQYLAVSYMNMPATFQVAPES